MDVERKMRHWSSFLQQRPRGDVLECGLRWAVEARRKEGTSNGGKQRKGKDRTGTEQAVGEDGSGKRGRARGDG